MSLQQVAWFEVHRFVVPWLGIARNWPVAGAWREMPIDAPRKIASVLDSGQHWALRLDCEQAARAEVASAIAAATDCGDIGRLILDRQALYAAKPRLKRAVP